MEQLQRDEFKALRTTIMSRGTVRAITFLVTMVAWATLTLLFAVSGPRNIVGALLTLMVLAAGFEAIFQLHLGVERVGRYLQVAFEEAAKPAAEGTAARGPQWETVAMAYGRRYPAAGSDALFSAIFVLATLVNMLPVLQAWRVPGAAISLLVAHLAFVVRIRVARHVAATQRADDLVRFRELLAPQAGPRADGAAPSQAEGAQEPPAEAARTPQEEG